MIQNNIRCLPNYKLNKYLLGILRHASIMLEIPEQGKLWNNCSMYIFQNKYDYHYMYRFAYRKIKQCNVLKRFSLSF